MGSTLVPAPPSAGCSGTCGISPPSVPVSCVLARGRGWGQALHPGLVASAPPGSLLPPGHGDLSCWGMPRALRWFSFGFCAVWLSLVCLEMGEGAWLGSFPQDFWCHAVGLLHCSSSRQAAGSHGSAGGGQQEGETCTAPSSPFPLSLQTTARTRKLCWEPATAARVSESPQIPTVPASPHQTSPHHPSLHPAGQDDAGTPPFQLLCPNPRQRCPSPGSAKPLALQFKPV